MSNLPSREEIVRAFESIKVYMHLGELKDAGNHFQTAARVLALVRDGELVERVSVVVEKKKPQRVFGPDLSPEEHGKAVRSDECYCWGFNDAIDALSPRISSLTADNKKLEAELKEARETGRILQSAASDRNLEIIKLTSDRAELLAVLKRLVINHNPEWPTTPDERDRTWGQATQLIAKFDKNGVSDDK